MHYSFLDSIFTFVSFFYFTKVQERKKCKINTIVLWQWYQKTIKILHLTWNNDKEWWYQLHHLLISWQNYFWPYSKKLQNFLASSRLHEFFSKESNTWKYEIWILDRLIPVVCLISQFYALVFENIIFLSFNHLIMII